MKNIADINTCQFLGFNFFILKISHTEPSSVISVISPGVRAFNQTNFNISPGR